LTCLGFKLTQSHSIHMDWELTEQALREYVEPHVELRKCWTESCGFRLGQGWRRFKLAKAPFRWHEPGQDVDAISPRCDLDRGICDGYLSRAFLREASRLLVSGSSELGDSHHRRSFYLSASDWCVTALLCHSVCVILMLWGHMSKPMQQPTETWIPIAIEQALRAHVFSLAVVLLSCSVGFFGALQSLVELGECFPCLCSRVCVEPRYPVQLAWGLRFVIVLSGLVTASATAPPHRG
jgi:hypothetical protein